MLNLTSMDSDLFWPSEFLPKKNFGSRGNTDESTHCVLDHAVFRKAHLLNRYSRRTLVFRHAIFHHFNHTIQGFGTWSCGQLSPQLTSWPVGVLAVYHCPTPSAFVPWSKDLEAEDPEKFGSQNPCVAMTHIFSEVKGMEILGDWRYKYVKLTNCFKFHIDMTSMQFVHEKRFEQESYSF